MVDWPKADTNNVLAAVFAYIREKLDLKGTVSQHWDGQTVRRYVPLKSKTDKI